MPSFAGTYVRVRAATRLKNLRAVSISSAAFWRATPMDGGELEVSTTGHQGSHIFSSFQPG